MEQHVGAGKGSVVDDDTLAVFDRSAVRSASTFTTIVISGAAPTASDAREHDTVAVPEQVQPVPDADTKLVPAGTASDTDTEVATDGPPLETANVYVRF